MSRSRSTACRLAALAAMSAAALSAQGPPAPSELAAPPADAERRSSGLVTQLLRPGSGDQRPGPDDLVQIHYSCWTAEGKLVASTLAGGRPVRVPVHTLGPGLAEALQLMVPGEGRRLWVPPELAGTVQGAAGEGMLVFDLQLLDVTGWPAVPTDVGGPPPEAERTASGLATKVLRPGTGAVRPRRRDVVTVRYSGWTTDGKMFDSTALRGRLASFRVNQVIPGWAEGLQLMVEGEQRRLWIPEELAYGGEEGKPRGMLVFDLELVSIQ